MLVILLPALGVYELLLIQNRGFQITDLLMFGGLGIVVILIFLINRFWPGEKNN